MDEYLIECLYCGLRYAKKFYTKIQVESERCMSCKDRNLKVIPLKEAFIDTYEGAPPFKENNWVF